MTDESVQGRPDDAGVFATTALALGQALAEIATLVGLNPDDGELYPITDRVRRLAEAQQQRAALWDLCKKIIRFAMIERCKSCHDDGKELAALRASAVVLPENAYRKIDRALTANPYLSDLEVLAALGVITKLLDSWRPATVEAAPEPCAETCKADHYHVEPPLCQKCCGHGVHDTERPGSIFGHFCLECIGQCHDMSDESSIHMCVIDRWTSSAAGVSGTGMEANDG